MEQPSRPPAVDGAALVTCALGPDCAGTVITEVLERARRRIDCAVYEVGAAYRWIFLRAAQRGVRVRLLLDGHSGDGNRSTVAAVMAGQGECRLVPRGGRGHWKLAVVDAETVAAGTGNLIWRDAPRDARHRLPPEAPALRGTREWWITVSSAPALAADALAHLERTWESARPVPAAWLAGAALDRRPQPPPVGHPSPAVSPCLVEVDPAKVSLDVGGAAIAARLRALIDGARLRALVTVPYVRAAAPEVGAVLASLRAARARGVDARLLLGTPPVVREEVMGLEGLPLAAMDATRSTSGHAKGAVIDDTACVSSANWSSAGTRSAWEAALVVADPVASGYFADAFQRDWAVAMTLDAAAVSVRRGAGILGVT